MIRIVIICEQEHDRGTILARLSSQNDFQITRVGKSGYDALRSADDLHPDIIIMDSWMSDISGTDLAPLIKRKSPQTGLVAISSRNEVGWVNQALKAGISGFLFKHTDMDKLTEAIRTVIYGGYFFSEPVKQHVAAVLSSTAVRIYPAVCFILEKTSPTERRIINYLARGYSDKEIADDLHLAVGTVRNALSALKRRAGLKSRIHVVINAHLCGLINDPPDSPS